MQEHKNTNKILHLGGNAQKNTLLGLLGTCCLFGGRCPIVGQSINFQNKVFCFPAEHPKSLGEKETQKNASKYDRNLKQTKEWGGGQKFQLVLKAFPCLDCIFLVLPAADKNRSNGIQLGIPILPSPCIPATVLSTKKQHAILQGRRARFGRKRKRCQNQRSPTASGLTARVPPKIFLFR